MSMTPRIITDGLEFPEGPLELPGGDILVTEIRAGRLSRVRPDGTKSVFAVTGGGPNGAALGPDGAFSSPRTAAFAGSSASCRMGRPSPARATSLPITSAGRSNV